MNRLKLISFCGAALMLCGCSDDKTQRLQQQVATLTSQVERLTERVNGVEGALTHQAAWMTSNVTSLWNHAEWTTSTVSSLWSQVAFGSTNLFGSQRTVFLPSTGTGWQRIDTDQGSFFIAFEDAQPYLDGYKVRLLIGNPSSASFHDFDLDLAWGRVGPVERKSSTKVHFINELKPGAWNRVEVVLSPAQSDELRFLTVKMGTANVFLNKAPTDSRGGN